MKQIFYMFAIITLCLTVAEASSAKNQQADLPERPNPVSAAIEVGNETIRVSTNGTITINTPTGPTTVHADSNTVIQNGPTDIQISPDLLNGPGDPVFGQNRPLVPFNPMYGLGQSPLLNRLSAYFSTANGGFGFRMVFDRQISPKLRGLIAPEFLTYSFARSAQILGPDMPANTTRITLFHVPLGIQHQVSPKNRVVPHVGFGVGPILRFDHRPAGAGTYGHGGTLRVGSYNGQDALGFTLPILTEDYPDLSLTLGGHVSAGLNFKLGKKKDLGLALDGRYTLAKFTDALGSPGDFSGFSLGIGFGKHF